MKRISSLIVFAAALSAVAMADLSLEDIANKAGSMAEGLKEEIEDTGVIDKAGSLLNDLKDEAKNVTKDDVENIWEKVTDAVGEAKDKISEATGEQNNSSHAASQMLGCAAALTATSAVLLFH